MTQAQRILQAVRRLRPVWTGLFQLVFVVLVAASGATVSLESPPNMVETPVPTVTPTPTEPPMTPTLQPEVWLKNHRVAEMWSGPVSGPGVISFGQTSSQFCVFRLERPDTGGSRLYVYNPHNDGRFWIDADAVGPVEPPRHSPGFKPLDVNCTEIIFDGPPAPTRTPTPPVTATAEASSATATIMVTPTRTMTPTLTPAAQPVRP